MAALVSLALEHDRSFSAVLQQMELGRLGEIALMIPGTICGIPEASTSVLLAMVAYLTSPSLLGALILLPQLVIYLVVFCAIVLYSKLPEKWLSSPAMMPEAAGNLALTAWLMPALLPVQISFLLATVATLLVTSTLKLAARRRRPAIAEYERLRGVIRHVDLSRYYVAKREAEKSFPSADAAEAAVFFTTVAFAQGGGGAWWWLLGAVVPCFGRIYFHAHYLLDVLCGFMIGLSATLTVHSCLGVLGRAASAWDLLFAVVAYGVLKHLAFHSHSSKSA